MLEQEIVCPYCGKKMAWPPKSGQFVLKFYIMPFYASH